MTTEPLELLVERLTRGDLTAADPLYSEFERYLRRIVRRCLPNRLRAKFDSIDVVQSVWADLIAGMRAARWRFKTPDQLRAFLVRAARNRLIDRIRQQRAAAEREQPLGDSAEAHRTRACEPTPSQYAQAGDLWQRLLALCPPEHHALLRMKGEGLPLDVIAQRTGLHVDSVRRVLRRLARQVALESRAAAAETQAAEVQTTGLTMFADDLE